MKDDCNKDIAEIIRLMKAENAYLRETVSELMDITKSNRTNVCFLGWTFIIVLIILGIALRCV